MSITLRKKLNKVMDYIALLENIPRNQLESALNVFKERVFRLRAENMIFLRKCYAQRSFQEIKIIPPEPQEFAVIK